MFFFSYSANVLIKQTFYIYTDAILHPCPSKLGLFEYKNPHF